MSKTIKRSWSYQQSPQEIWAYLTQSELIAKWLMPNDFKLELGYEFTFKTNPIPPLGLDGTFYCVVLEIVPEKKLVYSWKGGTDKAAPVLDTIVEWTLEAKDEGTDLHLAHSGFSEANAPIFGAMYEGWNDHIQRMITDLIAS